MEPMRRFGFFRDQLAEIANGPYTLFADAQATIAALQEKLTAALKVKADYDRWLSGGVYFTTAEYEKHAEDHRQREAALQARVNELEEWKRIVTGAGTDQESVIRLAAHEYTKIAVQCWKEANAKLESALTQRTAELERAEAGYFVAERDLRGMNNKYDELREQNRVLRANLVNCAARLEACYGEDYPAVRDAKAALTATSQPGGTHEL